MDAFAPDQTDMRGDGCRALCGDGISLRRLLAAEVGPSLRLLLAAEVGPSLRRLLAAEVGPRVGVDVQAKCRFDGSSPNGGSHGTPSLSGGAGTGRARDN